MVIYMNITECLFRIANVLDEHGLYNLSDDVDGVLFKVADAEIRQFERPKKPMISVPSKQVQELEMDIQGFKAKHSYVLNELLPLVYDPRNYQKTLLSRAIAKIETFLNKLMNFSEPTKSIYEVSPEDVEIHIQGLISRDMAEVQEAFNNLIYLANAAYKIVKPNNEAGLEAREALNNFVEDANRFMQVKLNINAGG